MGIAISPVITASSTNPEGLTKNDHFRAMIRTAHQLHAFHHAAARALRRLV